MKLVVLYRPESEFARATEEYMQDFKRLHGHIEVDAINVDSIEGSRMVELYDAVEYPALLAIANDGKLLNMWTGSTLPLMDEVAGYFVS